MEINILRNSLIKTRCVGVFVLLYDGNYKGDEFGPEVQVFDAGTLLIWRYRLGLEINRHHGFKFLQHIIEKVVCDEYTEVEQKIQTCSMKLLAKT